jgi:subtilisin family serine protease
MNKKIIGMILLLCIFGVTTGYSADIWYNASPPEGISNISKVLIPSIPDIPNAENPSSSSMSAVAPHITISNETGPELAVPKSNDKVIEAPTSVNRTPANVTYAPDRVIVKYQIDNVTTTRDLSEIRLTTNTGIGATVLADERLMGVPGMEVVKLPTGTSVQKAINYYTKDPGVVYAEPDYIVYALPTGELKNPVPIDAHALSYRELGEQANRTTGISHVTGIGVALHVAPTQVPTMTASSIGGQVTPNDPFFSYLYGLHNTGQTGGTADADIDAPEAWATTTGSSSVIVAVIDTGIDYTHPDLAANIWTDPATGYHGYDYVNYDNDPMDDHGHGTHCAGTVGAVGNNGVGVAGVNWNVKIMAVKFLDSTGRGYTSDAISAIQYANSHGAQVISNSWGGDGYSQSLKDAIDASPTVVICAAGNDGKDTDTSPNYPSAYTSSNIIAVAATDDNDALAAFSNYGATSVDVAAPGVLIYSTYPGNRYVNMSGTSMATPHVAGVTALVKAAVPSYTVAQIKAVILNGVDLKSGLSRKCVTGGRVNAKLSLSSSSSLSNIGVFRGAGSWFLDHDGSYSWTSDDLNWIKYFGLSGDIPVAGDWNGDGIDELGVFRQGTWFLDHDGSYSWSADDLNWIKYFGISGDIPVTGDWNGDGIDELGIYRQGAWFLDHDGSNSWSADDLNWIKYFGISGDIPVAGDWNGDRIDELGIYRQGAWFLDHDQSYSWSADDLNWIKYFGISGDTPVAGAWSVSGTS